MFLTTKDAQTDKVILRGIIYADKIKPTKPITKIDEVLLQDCKEALKACLAYGGIGIAANQIGIQKSFFIIRLPDKTDLFQVFFNPYFKSATQETQTETEGCLSVPGAKLLVPRLKEIKAGWQEIVNGEFEAREELLSDYMAIVFQHELDHLNGLNIVNRTKELNRASKRELLKNLTQR